MKRYVLDASAVMAFLDNRRGADRVRELFIAAAESQRPLLMSVVNWGEVYYSVWQSWGQAALGEKMGGVERLPIEVVDVDMDTTKLAASLKARHKLPYVDCFAAALAQQKKATLVTTDKDFVQVEKQVTVLWATGT